MGIPTGPVLRAWYPKFAPVLAELHAHAGLSHGLAHVTRVALLAEHIAVEEAVSPDLCVLAALFHDAGHAAAAAAGTDDHERRSVAVATPWLSEVLDQADLDEVLEAVAGRRYAKSHLPRGPVGAVLDDADNLDAIGLSGVARAYLWLGERHTDHAVRVPGDDPWVAATHDQRNLRRHWDDKLSTLRDRMRTATGRRLARQRHAATASFVEALAAENSALWPV